MKHQLKRFAVLMLIGACSVSAQKLSAQPFPPLSDGKVTVQAEGFAPNTSVRLAFNLPKPTKLDGSSLPVTVKTDANGKFALIVKASTRLSMSAMAGTQKAELKLEPPVPAAMPVLTVKGDTLESPTHYGLHRHFTQGSSILMFGGGVKKGHLHGATADERPLVAIKDPVTIPDLHATIFSAMGISPKTSFDVEQRPFYATLDGKGVPVTSIFG